MLLGRTFASGNLHQPFLQPSPKFYYPPAKPVKQSFSEQFLENAGPWPFDFWTRWFCGSFGKERFGEGSIVNGKAGWVVADSRLVKNVDGSVAERHQCTFGHQMFNRQFPMVFSFRGVNKGSTTRAFQSSKEAPLTAPPSKKLI